MFFEPINEAYFGKTPEILDIERAMSKVRNKFNIKSPLREVIEDKDTLLFADKIAKAFGFKKVYFGLDPSNVYNCYTIPIRQARYGDLTEDYVVTKTGIKYKEECKYETLIVSTTALFFDKNITDGEMMAVILHEIGHSFTEAVVPIQVFFDIYREAIYNRIMTILIISKKKADSVVPDTSKLLDRVFNIFKKIPDLARKILPDSPTTQSFILTLGRASDRRRYIDEKFSDQFAAMYGYGPELASVLTKIDYDKKYKDPSGEMGKLLDSVEGLINVSLEALLSNTPMLASRMRSSTQLLEHEIRNNKAMTPELKEDLRKQIEEIDVLAKQYSSIDNTPKYYESRKGYFAFMYNTFSTGDIWSKLLADTYNLDKINDTLEKRKV